MKHNIEQKNIKTILHSYSSKTLLITIISKTTKSMTKTHAFLFKIMSSSQINHTIENILIG